MKMKMAMVTLLVIIGVAVALPQDIRILKNRQSQERYIDTEEEFEEEKRPYSFAWTASRYYNGAPDREHKEERGEDGVTRGVFRYIDPRHNVQEVIYYADETGFHVEASNLPQDTPAVSAAKIRHQELFERIRLEHLRIGQELNVDNYQEE